MSCRLQSTTHGVSQGVERANVLVSLLLQGNWGANIVSEPGCGAARISWVLTNITILGGQLLLQGGEFGLQALVRTGSYSILGSLVKEERA
jgi:hypothetical protein